MGISLSFQESLSGIKKTIEGEREVICSKCHGTKEAEGSESSNCYSCKGEGTKKDPLFHKESKCNTCNGFGRLVRNPCRACQGIGTVREKFSKQVEIPRFVESGQVIEYLEEGNQTIFWERGSKHGDLKLTVSVSLDPLVKRDG